MIETWGFREDIKDIVAVDDDVDDNNVDNDDVDDDNNNNDKDSNDDKGISALGLDRDMGFSQGPSYGTPCDISCLGFDLSLGLDLHLGLRGQYFK